MTEGEEADAEESDTDSKRPSNTSVAESGREGAGATEDEEGREGGEDGDEADDAVEEFKPEEEEEEDGEVDKRENGALFHQFTRTSVESQPGSLEDIGTESPHNLVSSIEVPKRAACVCGQRRSRSPGRVKRSKPKECDVELN